MFEKHMNVVSSSIRRAKSLCIPGLSVEETDTAIVACKSTNDNTQQAPACLAVSHPAQQKQPTTNLFQLIMTKSLLVRSAETPIAPRSLAPQCTLTANTDSEKTEHFFI